MVQITVCHINRRGYHPDACLIKILKIPVVQDILLAQLMSQHKLTCQIQMHIHYRMLSVQPQRLF